MYGDKTQDKPDFNPLKYKRVYLSGPIEHATGGDGWRENLRNVLTDEFEVDLLDPHADEKQMWAKELHEAQKNCDYETMRRIARGFVRKDMAWVDRCDFLIAYLPYKVATTGTHHEIIYASDAKKPTLLVCPEGKQYNPLWYYGFIGEKGDDYMFGSWDELYDYLREVKDWKHTENFDWAFVYGLV